MAKPPRRRTVTATVTLTVPFWMTAAEARREIRSRVNHQAAYMSGKMVDDRWHDLYPPNDVRVRRITPASRS